MGLNCYIILFLTTAVIIFLSLQLTYYDEVVKDKKTHVEGSLRTKYYGVRRIFRKAGLIKKQTLVEEIAILEDLG